LITLLKRNPNSLWVKRVRVGVLVAGVCCMDCLPAKQAQPTWRRVTTSVLPPVCEHLRLYKFQTETKRGEAESRTSTNKSKWKKKSWQGQRWLESTKHRDQVYHIDENHLNSARSPRASTNTRGTVYPVHIHSTGEK